MIAPENPIMPETSCVVFASSLRCGLEISGFMFTMVVNTFIVELTKYFTLWPGDVIWMGTDGASPNIKAGDVVEVEITGIGTLRNRFVAENRGSAA